MVLTMDRTNHKLLAALSLLLGSASAQDWAKGGGGGGMGMGGGMGKGMDMGMAPFFSGGGGGMGKGMDMGGKKGGGGGLLCYTDPDWGISYPSCNEFSYCDGFIDCSVPEYCGCPAGLMFCNTGINPCEGGGGGGGGGMGMGKGMGMDGMMMMMGKGAAPIGFVPTAPTSKGGPPIGGPPIGGVPFPGPPNGRPPILAPFGGSPVIDPLPTFGAPILGPPTGGQPVGGPTGFPPPPAFAPTGGVTPTFPDPPIFPTTMGGTVADILLQNTFGDPAFGILVEVLTVTGLLPVLGGEGPYTVMAPTDHAFLEVEAAFPGMLGCLIGDPDFLASVLLFHVVPNDFSSADLFPGQLFTLAGDPIEVIFRSDGAIFLFPAATGGDAEIVYPDFEATNGYVHGISSVLGRGPDLVDFYNQCIEGGSPVSAPSPSSIISPIGIPPVVATPIGLPPIFKAPVFSGGGKKGGKKITGKKGDSYGKSPVFTTPVFPPILAPTGKGAPILGPPFGGIVFSEEMSGKKGYDDDDDDDSGKGGKGGKKSDTSSDDAPSAPTAGKGGKKSDGAPTAGKGGKKDSEDDSDMGGKKGDDSESGKGGKKGYDDDDDDDDDDSSGGDSGASYTTSSAMSQLGEDKDGVKGFFAPSGSAGGVPGFVAIALVALIAGLTAFLVAGMAVLRRRRSRRESMGDESSDDDDDDEKESSDSQTQGSSTEERLHYIE